MSILNSTRLNFFGGIEVDVSVPNNKADYEVMVDGVSKTIDVFNPYTAAMSDEAIKLKISDGDIINSLRAKYGDYFVRGGWNNYGLHTVTTNNAQIRSAGVPGKVSTNNAMAGLPFFLLGSANPESGQFNNTNAMMVDLNPLGSTYSQIALGGILVGTLEQPLLHLKGDRIISNVGNSAAGLSFKLLNGNGDSPGSNMFAGTWQVTYPITTELKQSVNSGSQDADQQMLAFLNTRGATGVVVNFSFFEMCPKYTTEQQRKSYYANQDGRNPSVGRIIGSIGLAFDGETTQNPDGRLLLSSLPNTPAGPQTTPIWAALYEYDNKPYLSLNLSLALLQKNFRTNRTDYNSDTLNAAIDFGSLVLEAGQQTMTFVPDYVDYYKYGGVIDILLTNQQQQVIEQNPISIIGHNQENNRSLSITESQYRIFSDDINNYIGDKAGDSKDVNLQVRYLGQAVNADLTVDVARNNIQGTNNSTPFLDLSIETIKVSKGNTSVSYTIKVAEEIENIDDVNSMAGFEDVQFTFGSAVQVINTRKYRYTDFGIASGSKVSWQQVYENVLRYHYLNFPGMSTLFPLNSAEQILNNKEGIKARTSSQYWPTSLYMPVVRSMSPSQIRLLNAFMFDQEWDPDKPI